MARIQLRISAIAILAFVCLVSAQQQPSPNGTITATERCNQQTTKPHPAQKSYVVPPCVLAKFSAYLSMGHGQYIELNDGVVNSTMSSCAHNGNTTQLLVIDFGNCTELAFTIEINNKTEIYVSGVNGWVMNKTEQVKLSNSTELFRTSKENYYYKCNSEQTVKFGFGVDLVLSNFAYEAFHKAPGSEFSKIAEECALDSSQVSDLVRIGVGVCLVALVVIVLIAYFVGRRRWSERSSYESV